MASKHREEKAIAAVACPTCGAPRGEPCRHPTAPQAIAPERRICADRRRAWQMIRDGVIKDEKRK